MAWNAENKQGGIVHRYSILIFSNRKNLEGDRALDLDRSKVGKTALLWRSS